MAPQLFQAQWAPRYITSLEIHLGLCTSFLRFHIASPIEGTDALFIITCLVTRVLLQRRNSKKIAAQTQEDGTVVNTNSRAFEVSRFSLIRAAVNPGRNLMLIR